MVRSIVMQSSIAIQNLVPRRRSPWPWPWSSSSSTSAAPLGCAANALMPIVRSRGYVLCNNIRQML